MEGSRTREDPLLTQPARAQVAAARAKVAAESLDTCAEAAKETLTPLYEAIALAPEEVLQDLSDANLNLHHALGRLNSARAMLERLRA